jgi:hypothetical protein
MMTRIFLLIAIVASIQGCATVTKGGYQNITVETPGCSGAECKLTNKDGAWYVTTPGSVMVERSNGDLTLFCRHPNLGKEPLVTTWNPKTGGWVWGNILLGGVIGAGVDLITGNAYDYPQRITLPIDCSVPVKPEVDSGIVKNPDGPNWSLPLCLEVLKLVTTLPKDDPQASSLLEQHERNCKVGGSLEE